MNYYVLRSFDHAGYYETRLLLLLVTLGVVIWFARRRRDHRYLIAFLSGVLFQSLMEWTLKRSSLRGANFTLSVFGWLVPDGVTWLFQGCIEGGVLSVMSFWFLDLYWRRKQGQAHADQRGYWLVCGLIVVLAAIVGVLAAGRPITSPRPMFASSALSRVAINGLISMGIVWWRGRRLGLRYLFWFWVGLLIYAVLTFETLHLTGARYIGVPLADGQFAAAPFPMQILLMLWSHIWDIAFSKIHYFAVPFALGLLKFREEKNEDVFVQGLQNSVR